MAGEDLMTDREILIEIESVTLERPRKVVDTAAVAMVPSIVDEELAAVRARFAARLEAERRRVHEKLEREASRAWWRAFDQRRSGKVTAIRRSA
jgi:hypothetical protein